jgi:hypothetical protein
VVLVHDQRNVRVLLDRGLDQVLDEGLAGVLAGTGAGLQDDGRAGFLGGFHHGLDLFEVVDVEGRNAVAVGGCVIQQFAHRDECHGKYLAEIGEKEGGKTGENCRNSIEPPCGTALTGTSGE